MVLERMQRSSLNPVFSLRRTGRKEVCPNCNHRTLVPYVHTESGTLLDGFGMCDREIKCGFRNHPNRETVLNWNRWNTDGRAITGTMIRRVHAPIQPQEPEPVFVPDAVLRGFERWAWDSHFVQFLTCCLPFPHPTEQVDRIIHRYRLGGIPMDSGDALGGGIVFPFIDNQGRIRSLQVVKYNPLTNRREGFNWVHKTELKRPVPPQWAIDFDAYQKAGGKPLACLFGSHLIDDSTQTVVVCEAPKTAIYMALRMERPGVVYAATASLGNLTVDRLRFCVGKTVVLCPDLSAEGTAFQRWSARADELRRDLGLQVVVDETLERMATVQHRASGWDYADFLADFNWEEHNQKQHDNRTDRD